MSTVLCHLDDLEATGAKGMTVDHQGNEYSMFVVRKDDGVYAYINHCPHAGAPLEMQEDKFLDDDGKHIVCAMHGALFQIEDGLCIDGPCFNDSLSQVPVVIIDGQVVIDA